MHDTIVCGIKLYKPLGCSIFLYFSAFSSVMLNFIEDPLKYIYVNGEFVWHMLVSITPTSMSSHMNA